MRLTPIVIPLVFLVGCSARGDSRESTAVIDDGRTYRGGLHLLAIDGQEPQRARSAIHTVIPVVLVEPGVHSFTVKGSVEPFTAEVEAGKRYRVLAINGVPALAEAPPREKDNGGLE